MRYFLWFSNTVYVLMVVGPLSAPIGVEGNAFVTSKWGNQSWPDLQITFIASHPGFDGGTVYKNFLRINTKVWILWEMMMLLLLPENEAFIITMCIKNKPCCRSLMNILCEMHLAKDIRSTPFCWGPNRVDKSAWGHRILKIIPRFNPITWRIRTMSKFWLKVCF